MTVLAAVSILMLTAVSGASPSLTLTSPTHPDENTWYTGNIPAFNWSSSNLHSEIILGQAKDVAVSGGYAYVADGTSGLTIVDVSDPDSPVIAGNFDTPGSADAVAVAQQYAYVADGATVQIINVSDAANATLAAYMNIPTSTISIQGNKAYMIQNDRLQVYSISNPASPVYQSGISMSSVLALDVSGNYAYAICSGIPFSSLKVINIASTPAIAGTVTVSAADDIDVQVNPMDGKPYAYLAGNNPGGMKVVDVSNPASPFVTYTGTGFSTNVSANGSTVYLIINDIFLHDTGMNVMDASNPAALAQVRSIGFFPKGSFYASEMVVSGDDAYVVGSGKMRIYHTAQIQYSHALDQSPLTAPDNIPEGSMEPGASATYTAAALPDGEYYFHVASIEGTSVGPVRHRRVRIGSSCGQTPGLSLGIGGVRWATYADYQARSLTVDFDVSNPSGPAAYGTSLSGAVNSNGVTVDSAMPQLVGDTPAGSMTAVSLRYHVPVGVSYFRTEVFATAQDTCGASYEYPGPFPGA